MPLRLLSEVENLLHHVSRPMKLPRNDPFVSSGRQGHRIWRDLHLSSLAGRGRASHRVQPEPATGRTRWVGPMTGSAGEGEGAWPHAFGPWPRPLTPTLAPQAGRGRRGAVPDAFALPGRRETTAKRQPPNVAQPFRRLRPPYLDTGQVARGAIAGFLVSINSGCAHLDRYEASRCIIRAPVILLADRHLVRSRQSTRITGIIHRLSRAAMRRKAILKCGRFR